MTSPKTQSSPTRLWLPLLCVFGGILISKLVELSYTDWKFLNGHEAAAPFIRQNTTARENAVFVVLSRNSDVYGIARSIRSVEDRFNHKYGYDWVFLNDEPFNQEFKSVTSSLVSGRASYGLVPKEHWSYPSWIDQDRAAEVRKENADLYLHGDSESYRHMCRYFSGFFYRHELLQKYDYYWRVEPDIELWCDVDSDLFHFMRTNKVKYGFVITLRELPQTITTLWATTKEFFREHKHALAKSNSVGFLSDDKGKTYNGCHFWSNFEIGAFDWLRSPQYEAYFNHLDKAGGFFYERWGDAPVHSLAAGIMLNRTEIHHFNEIGYSHDLYTHCPTGEAIKRTHKCYCNPAKNVDWSSLSCLPKWYGLNNLSIPKGFEDELELVRAEEEKSAKADRVAEAEGLAYEQKVKELKGLLQKAQELNSQKCGKGEGENIVRSEL